MILVYQMGFCVSFNILTFVTLLIKSLILLFFCWICTQISILYGRGTTHAVCMLPLCISLVCMLFSISRFSADQTVCIIFLSAIPTAFYLFICVTSCFFVFNGWYFSAGCAMLYAFGKPFIHPTKEAQHERKYHDFVRIKREAHLPLPFCVFLIFFSLKWKEHLSIAAGALFYHGKDWFCSCLPLHWFYNCGKWIYGRTTRPRYSPQQSLIR